MLKKIQRLKRCGIFQDFTWSSSGLEDCEKFNLIFGWNGTGKSTLSGILRHLELRQTPDGDHIQLEWDSSVLRETDFLAAQCSLKVFNSDFIDETVEGELKPIAVFGKASIEKKKTLDDLVAELSRIFRSLPKLKQAKEKAEKELDRFCVATAKSLKTALGREGNAYSNYDKRKLKAKAEDLSKLDVAARKLLPESEQEKLLTQIRSPFKETVAKPTLEVPDLERLRKDVTALRKRTIIAEAIDSLSNDEQLSHWVQEGLAIHEERGSDGCLYCGQAIPIERKAALEKHFSDELTQLQNDITASLQAIDDSLKAMRGVEYPKKAELVDHLTGNYSATQAAAKKEVDGIASELQRLRKGLEEKRGRVFDSLSTSHSDPVVEPSHWNRLLKLLDNHNEASRNHTNGISEAQKRYENARILECLSTYEEKKEAASKAAVAFDGACRRRDECKKKSRILREELVSHKIPAKQITADLARYLGHSDLAFEAHDEGYRVMRRGETAKKLSDGEKTAIAVLYFLKTFADEAFRLEESVIVFDDPVSSLDSNALYNAFAFIKDRSKNAKQLIILTHNFPFFRLVREWFKNLRGQEKRQWRIMMLEASCEANGRHSTIVKIDPLLIAFESEYQYLFGRIYSLAATEGSPPLEHFLPSPNMARRVLEAFLAFKAPFPGNSTFYSRLEFIEKDAERRSRIYRFCNMQSHLNAVGDYDEDLSSLSGAPALLRDVLALIKNADAEHYEGMVNCVAASKSKTA